MEQKNRFNQLITTALNTSPLARACHDAYYKSFYTYGARESSVGNHIAYVDHKETAQGKNIKLVLSMDKEDHDIITLAHHELSHVVQIAESEKLNISFLSNKMAFGDEIALRLIWEAQAHANQIEGPVLGFFNDLKNGDYKNIDFYKNHFPRQSIVGDTKTETLKYMETIVEEDLSHAKSNFVDLAGYYYLNKFNPQEKEIKQAKQTEARKNLVGSFFNKTDAQGNYLDDYLLSFVQQHEHNIDLKQRAAKAENSMMGQFRYSALEIEKNILFHKSPTVPLEKILKTTKLGEENYLSDTDWFDVLKAKTNEALVLPLIQSSSQAKVRMLVSKPGSNPGPKL